MDSLVSLVWVIAATVVAVTLILTVVRPLAWALARGRVGRRPPPMAVRPAADSEDNTLEFPPPAQIGASALKRLRELVDAHPDETCAVFRNWLHAA